MKLGLSSRGAGAIAILPAVLLLAASHTRAEEIPLEAQIRFDHHRGAINYQLIGTVQDSPVAQVNATLAQVYQSSDTSVAPPYTRLDVGFEGTTSDCNLVPQAPLYDAATNSFNYCALDARVSDALAAGAKPLLIIDYMPQALADPTCYSFRQQACPPANDAAYKLFGALVEATIVHSYQFSKGVVTDFEVWNEPDWVFFAGTLADYLRIYEVCNAALVKAEADLELAPGELHLGGPAALFNDPLWIIGLAADAVAKNLRLDFISWHNYANDPLAGPLVNVGGDSGAGLPPYAPFPLLYAGTYGDGTQSVRSWLEPFRSLRPDLNPELWIDEWNVNAGWDPRMDNSYDAAFMAASMHAMQDAGLDRAARFRTWDHEIPDPVQGHGNWGLFTHDGKQVRPALYEVAMWRAMAPTRVEVRPRDLLSRLRDQSNATRYTQNLIASVNSDSTRATIMLYNFMPYSPLYLVAPYCGYGPAVDAKLILKGLANGVWSVSQQQIDCNTAIAPFAPLDASLSSLVIKDGKGVLKVESPPDSLILLTLTK